MTNQKRLVNAGIVTYCEAAHSVGSNFLKRRCRMQIRYPQPREVLVSSTLLVYMEYRTRHVFSGLGTTGSTAVLTCGAGTCCKAESDGTSSVPCFMESPQRAQGAGLCVYHAPGTSIYADAPGGGQTRAPHME